MNTQNLKLAFVSAVFTATVSLFLSNTATTQSRTELSPGELQGRGIYLKGEDPARRGEITATLGSGDLEVPGSSFSCANCHGARGEGTKEGGLQPPPIDWETLTHTHTSALTRRERKAYDEQTLARAIKSGIDPAGAPLHPGMPQYRMTPEQLADLIAYLKKIGKEADTPPGVTGETIKVGAALPLSGPLASIGEDIRATLLASFAEINEQGGVYGRRFELVVEDSRGESAQTLEATRRLIEQRGVFALVGSFETGDNAALNLLIKTGEIPSIGPVTLSPRLAVPPNPFIFYLLPTFHDQARALVDFAQSKAAGKGVRFGVVYADNDFNKDALAGLKAQAKIYSTEVVAEYGYKAENFSPAEAVALMSGKKATHIFFFGNGADITALAREMERAGWKGSMLSSVVMIGRAAFDLPPQAASQAFLSYPSALPSPEDFASFINLMQRARVKIGSPAFQSVAYASAQIMIEAAKIGGRDISRSSLITSLEQLQDFKTGVLPPVTFGPNRRVGSASSYVVGIDLDKKNYVPVSDRLTPKDKP
ncbi:MAG TPA: ABC transporter substrate-binding protein [Pyrinomonadaceae bacterium]|nr:ABC transporter substrate-binding protein [Pyrinomonadaceae bacterium]